MRAPRDVAITGVGVVSPMGVGVDAFWSAARSGESALAETPDRDSAAPRPARALTLAARGFDASDHISARVIRRYSALSTLAVIAANEAASAADFGPGKMGDGDAGVALGTAFGSSDYHFEYYETIFRSGIKEASPLLFSESVLNAASGHMTQQLGLRGAGLTLVGGEDVGLQALMTALDRVRAGSVLYFAGGVEQYCPILHATLARCEAVGDGRGDPYGDSGALGAFGEGAGIVVCESAESARERGAAPLAMLRGAAAGRSRRPVDHDALAAAVARTVRLALEDARVDPADVGLVIGSGKGAASDRAELDGVSAALGAREADASRVPRHQERVLVATKPLTGEAFGFASAAQAVVAALALSSGELPRTPISKLPEGWRAADGGEHDARAALVVSMTAAGGVTALVLGAGE